MLIKVNKSDLDNLAKCVSIIRKISEENDKPTYHTITIYKELKSLTRQRRRGWERTPIS